MMIRILPIALLLAPALLLAQPKIETPTEIRDVTVYLRGAEITRTATARLVAGMNEVILIGLSSSADAKSVQVKGTGNATIQSIEYRVNYLKQTQQSREEIDLIADRDTFNIRLAFAQNERSGLEHELKLLEENRKMNASDKSIYIDDLQEAADFYRQRIPEIKNKITRLVLKEAIIQKDINELNEQIGRYSTSRKVPSGEVVIRALANVPGSASFTVTYYVESAGWEPIYNLRASKIDQPVSLDYDAIVRQNSGEEWKNVRLALSTGNPTLGGTKPELSAMWLNFMEHKKLAANIYRGNVAGAPKNKQASDEDAYFAKDSVSYASDFTQVVQTQLNVRFEIQLRYDIPSDAAGRQVRIQQKEVPATFEYATVPKLDPTAYLVGRLTGWEEYNLLPGRANVFFEGAFVGETYVDPTITSDTLTLSFGRDPRVVVERKEIKDENRRQYIGGNRFQTFTFEISVRNTRDAAILVVVEDQFPISKDKDIEVEVKDVSGGERNNETGKVVWKLGLAPAETKSVRLTYTVKYPKDRSISGLY